MINDQFSVQVYSHSRPIVTVDSYEVPRDQITFLFGESGIGKSMISKAIYGLLDGDELDISVNGKKYSDYLKETKTAEIKKNSFFVFQEPSSHLNPLLNISSQLREGSLALSDAEQEIMMRLWRGTDENAVKRILDVFPKPYRPSGGEKQRILLAMAFKKIDVFLQTKTSDSPSYFVFDEPTGSLDNTYRNLFIRLLFQCYQTKPFTVTIITHDYSVISELYTKYTPLLDVIHLKELRRSKGAAVELVDFSADDYLTWLDKSKPVISASGAQQPVLTMAPHFKIFGRKLCLYGDAAHSREKTLVINKGEMAYVKAPSGVGKTTLAKVILGLYKSRESDLTISGIAINENTPQKKLAKKIWGKRAGMVFQHADESLDLQSSVGETFAGLPLTPALNRESIKNKLHELFEQPLSEAFLSKKVAFLSGGQKQRLNLLRTLALGTDLIILDEPLNGLDFVSVKKVLELLAEKQKQGAALLMISHNEEIFDHFVDPQNIYYLAETA